MRPSLKDDEVDDAVVVVGDNEVGEIVDEVVVGTEGTIVGTDVGSGLYSQMQIVLVLPTSEVEPQNPSEAI
jgi:hypothetical protein